VHELWRPWTISSGPSSCNQEVECLSYERKMEFINHTVGGCAIGYAIGQFTGGETYLAAIGGALGAFPDVASILLYELTNSSWWTGKRYARWDLYAACHGDGYINRYCRWLPPWGLHTWLIDPVIHPSEKRTLLPKFKEEWKTLRWGRWTKWDVLYVTMDVLLYPAYLLVAVLARALA
jgi:hypothetical protein